MTGSFTVGPRVEFDPDHYPRIRVWSPQEEREYYVYLHRLTAYAHGEIDGLDDPRHVHHVDADPWNAHPNNLEAVTPEEHDERHAHPVIADGGEQEGTDPVDALEEHGTLLKEPAAHPTAVHIDRDCRNLKKCEPPVDVEHPGQIPLRAGLCRYCDPAIDVVNGNEDPPLVNQTGQPDPEEAAD